MDEIQDIKRRAGIVEDEQYQAVDVETFMNYVATYGNLTTRKAGPAVYFYPEGSIKPGYGGPEKFGSGAVAVYHPKAPKGPFLIAGGDVSRGSSGYGSTHDEGSGF